jgi:hypothetical protein
MILTYLHFRILEFPLNRKGHWKAECPYRQQDHGSSNPSGAHCCAAAALIQAVQWQKTTEGDPWEVSVWSGLEQGFFISFDNP